MNTDVLIIGSGGREHALAWKIAQSKRIGKIYCAPGNGGTESIGENVPIAVTAIDQLAKFATDKRIGLTVVGPEEPLSLGIVDLFKRSGLRIFGPTKAAAQIETSKSFAKKLMQDARIPTASYRAFTDVQQAHEYAERSPFPLVVKADGLALGKGVYICNTKEEAHAALDEVMVNKVHGGAGTEVVIEEFLVGEEISIHALCDGVNYALLLPSQDHKRIGDGDTGKNSAGMGTVAPVPWVTGEIMYAIESTIVKPLLAALGALGTPFQGVLFPGIMVTKQGPKVIELNARFGDPETQVYMRLLDNDLMDLIDDCVDGGIGSHPLHWTTAGAVNIVLASGGYPDEYKTGLPITGLEQAGKLANVVVFHAGTAHTSAIVTSGGRVLGVSATGSPLSRARDLAYLAADLINFEGKYMRHDIGAKSINVGR